MNSEREGSMERKRYSQEESSREEFFRLTTAKIETLLYVRQGYKYPYGISKDSENSNYPLHPETVRSCLKSLARDGLVEDGGREQDYNPKGALVSHSYTITEYGEGILKDQIDCLKEIVERASFLQSE